MTFPNRPVEAIEGWHAHVYYDPEKTKDTAASLRARIEETFPDTRMGRWHDEQVGPHLVSMYQVAFETHQFDKFVQWLAEYNEELEARVESGHAQVDMGFSAGPRRRLRTAG